MPWGHAARVPSPPPRLTLAGLRLAYDGAPVLDGLDLEVPAGELVALLGPSGAGKTSTLRLVAGLGAPDAGDVLLDGHSLLALPPQRRPVAVVFQSPLLFPHLSAGDNVAFGLRLRGVGRAERRRRAAAALARVHLPGAADRRVAELSGGERQRVALARALVLEPAVLLLDEPFAALDPALRAQLGALVAELVRDVGVSTLLVTHDQEEAAVLADRVAVLLDGRVRQCAPPRQLYARPATLSVARFLGGANAFPGVVVAGRFRGALGELPAPPGAVDGPGTLLVRQEAVAVGTPDAPGVLAAVVTRTRYRGAALDCTATTPAGVAVVATLPPDRRLRPGDRVGLRLRPDACHVVPEVAA